MNKILLKAIEELKKDGFSKEYVLGMLETLVEMQSSATDPLLLPVKPLFHAPPMKIQDKEVSEAEMLEKMAAARVREVEQMSTIEVVTQK